MSDKIGLFAGSFDPVTNGHLEIITQASHLFDMLYVGLFYNSEKSGFFSVDDRYHFLQESLADFPNIKVIRATQTLTVTLAKELGVTHLVRGLRNASDLEYESSLQFFNHHFEKNIETVFFLSSVEWSYLSSSRVRELIHFGADISDFVPESVVREVENGKYKNEH